MKAQRQRRAAFTLFEVALSLLVMATTVVIAMMSLPTVMRSHAQVRAQLVAATLAHEVLANARTRWDLRFASEGRLPEDRSYQEARGWGADLDSIHLYVSNRIKPVPQEIALRLDSDDELLRSHLAAGGRLYYQLASDEGTGSVRYQTTSTEAASRNIVFAIVGPPQQDAMRWLPQLRWPYYDYLPAPYQQGFADHNRPRQYFIEKNDSAKTARSDASKRGQGYDGAVLRALMARPGAAPAGIDNEAFYTAATSNDITPSSPDQPLDAPLPSTIEALFHGLASDHPGLFDALGKPGDTVEARLHQIFPPLPPDGTVVADPYAGDLFVAPELDDLVALYRADRDTDWDGSRYIATAHLLRYAAFQAGREAAPGRAVDAGNATERYQVERYRRLDDLARRWSRAIQLHHPYEMRLARDVTMPLFTDHPLLQLDLFAPPLADPASGSVRYQRHANWAWNFLVGEPIYAVRSESFSLETSPYTSTENPPIYPGPDALDWLALNPGLYPGLDPTDRRDAAPERIATDSARRNAWHLTNRFDAAERTRQFVAWSVDWMSYEDANDAISGPLDAALMPIQIHGNRFPLAQQAEGSQDGESLGGSHDPDKHNHFNVWHVGDLFSATPGMLNPELNTGLRAVGGGEEFADQTGDGNDDRQIMGGLWFGGDLINPRQQAYNAYAMAGTDITPFLGLHGALRTGNDEQLERGTVPPNVRLRATALLRINCYDPRGFVPRPGG
jgi:type II secretory pathway pseudopilin PulG